MFVALCGGSEADNDDTSRRQKKQLPMLLYRTEAVICLGMRCHCDSHTEREFKVFAAQLIPAESQFLIAGFSTNVLFVQEFKKIDGKEIREVVPRCSS